MKKIELTQNQYTLVDDDDYRVLSKHKWYASYNSHTRSYHAKRNVTKTNGKQTTIQMHRVITNCSNNLQVDHKNHNTLDNRKENLRICTQNQNQHNRKKYKNTSSKYKGVLWHKRDKKWTSEIGVNGKRIYLGYFDSEIDATKAYNKKAKELFGEYALLNDIKESV